MLELAQALPPVETYDAVIGPIAVKYPWGANLADEGLVAALYYSVKHAVAAWRDVERDRALRD